MKTIKLLSAFVIICSLYSCSVYSSFGSKKTTISSACDNCQSNSKFYRGFGEIEVAPEQPGARVDALSEAKLIARKEIINEIDMKAQVVAKRVAERNGKALSSAYAESVHASAFNQVQDTELKCQETALVQQDRRSPKVLVASVCIEMSKKDFDDSIYKENYEMFSSSGIDKKTYDIWLTSRVVKKK